jgi:hypothetical protein
MDFFLANYSHRTGVTDVALKTQTAQLVLLGHKGADAVTQGKGPVR